MTIDLDKLEALAKAATPGPWGRSTGDTHWMREVREPSGSGVAWCGSPTVQALRDSEYIAAASPDVLLELVRQLRERDAEVARLTARVAELERVARHETSVTVDGDQHVVTCSCGWTGVWDDPDHALSDGADHRRDCGVTP